MNLRRRLLVNAFSLPHASGFLRALDGSLPTNPVQLPELVDYAVSKGMSGIDVSLPEGVSPSTVRDCLAPGKLALVAEFGDLHGLSDQTARENVRDAATAGASTVRFVASPILCGARGACPVGWENRLRTVAARLRMLLPVADSEGVSVAIENHQDLDSEDILRLADAVNTHPRFGVVFDTGNPLAVAEDPVEFLERILPLVRHVHLKDYRLHRYPMGFRLVRCAAGEGVVRFEELLKRLDTMAGPDWTAGVEVAAQPTRTIPIASRTWQSGFPGRSLESFAPVLRTVLEHGFDPEVPYASLWESGASSARVVEDEWQVLDRSVAYFQGSAQCFREVAT